MSGAGAKGKRAVHSSPSGRVTVTRLSRVRQERRPNSRYASEEQCRYELRQAIAMYDRHKLPTVDTSAASVEEIAAVVIQTLAKLRRRQGTAPRRGTP